MTSILKVFGQKKRFLGVLLVQVQIFGTDTRYGQCGKRVKTKSQKVSGVNSYVCRSYRGKTSRGLSASPHPE